MAGHVVFESWQWYDSLVATGAEAIAVQYFADIPFLFYGYFESCLNNYTDIVLKEHLVHKADGLRSYEPF